MSDESEDPADPIRSARMRGREARERGEPLADNPHAASERLARAWEEGWREAEGPRS